MRQIEARTFNAKDEKEFWDWLGDAYIKSEDFTTSMESGQSETDVVLIIKTPDGEKEVNEGDVITKDDSGNFRVFTDKEFEKQHSKIEMN